MIVVVLLELQKKKSNPSGTIRKAFSKKGIARPVNVCR